MRRAHILYTPVSLDARMRVRCQVPEHAVHAESSFYASRTLVPYSQSCR